MVVARKAPAIDGLNLEWDQGLGVIGNSIHVSTMRDPARLSCSN